ncbi:hypothetical protein E4U41_001245 [Claviceps citrina]|nr:hypothetical protein E4U41_001245 [Claviceps citrina]
MAVLNLASRFTINALGETHGTVFTMDRPPNEKEQGASPQRMSRADYARNVQTAMDERRQKAMISLQRHQPQVHQQIQRLFPDYEPPFYARMRGFGRTHILALAESTILGVAASTERGISDTETQALTEHFLTSIHNMLAWKWVMTGLAGYMTYRGRKTMRFPFVTPGAVGGRFDPFTGGPQVRTMWHSARFVAYYGALWAMAEPVFQGANFLRQNYRMNADPRLAPLLRNVRDQAGEVLGAAQEETLGQEQQPQDYSSQAEDNYQSPSQAIRAQSQQAWTSDRRQEASKPSASKGWDVTDDVYDDASPIAPSAHTSQNQSSGTAAGSAWDRVRQQSQSYSSAPRQARAQSNPNYGWASDDEASPQYPGDRDSYSFSSTTDGEEAAARRRAQREFDELLERERGGADQERGSWGRK